MYEKYSESHLDFIERAAKAVGMETQRANFRELQVVQIKGYDGMWCTFDPIQNGKDLAKFLFYGAKKIGLHDNEPEFRKKLIQEMLTHDYTVQEER